MEECAFTPLSPYLDLCGGRAVLRQLGLVLENTHLSRRRQSAREMGQGGSGSLGGGRFASPSLTGTPLPCLPAFSKYT